MQICQDLRRKIKEGIYPINGRLPEGGSLAQEYGVSLMTLKRALDVLVAEGYIIRRRGDGTLVRDWKKQQLPHLYSLKGTYYDYKERVRSKVIRFEINRASEEIAEKLNVNPDDCIYEIMRLRELDGRPIIMEYTYMPIDVIPGLKQADLEHSIYGYIQEELGRKVHSAFVKITGVRPNALEIKYMSMLETDFLMEAERISSLDNCQTFEYSIAHHLPEFFDFETVLFNN